MSYGILASGARILPPIRHRVFVSYHHAGDQAYYDAFSKTFHDGYEAIYDNSLERRIDSDNAEYVIQRIRDHFITGTSCTIVLVGAETWKRKYVDWEIKATLDKEHGLIGVRLPTAPVNQNYTVTVPGRLHDNISSGYALWISWADLTATPANLQQYIASARAKSRLLIDNSRERMQRNS